MEPVRPNQPTPLPEKYDAAIFFDNDPNQIKFVKSFCNTIRCVKVEHSDYIKNIPWSPDVIDGYKRSLGKNYYAMLMEKTDNKLHYDPISGLSEADFAQLEEWINTLRNAADVIYKVAIFDWDRTISKFEGVSLGFTENLELYKDILHIDDPALTEERMMEDMLIYICGGAERLARLRDMFVMLATNGIDIIILTNNGGCYKPSFKAMVDKLLPEGIQAYLACSAKFASKSSSLSQDVVLAKSKLNSIRGHKGYKLYTIPQFKDDICSIPSNSNSNSNNSRRLLRRGRASSVSATGTSRRRRGGGKKRTRKNMKRRGKTRKNYL